MILKQYYLGCLAHASYLIGDEDTHTAIIVDPQRDVSQYIDDALKLGLSIRAVFLTHLHADFVAGHLELRDRAGARIYLGARAGARYEHTPLEDGDVLEFGRVRLKVLETPGHTPESISIVVYDLAKSDREPHAVLTGDALFVGDVGRPDLLGAVGLQASDLGGMLYDSLRNKLMTLPDATLLYPAHGAGSMCGKKLGAESHSTIGEQRAKNYALQPMTKEQFVRIVLEDQPEPPGYFIHDRLMNQAERHTLEENLRHALKPLPLELVLRLLNSGAAVVDTREPAAWAAAHLAGSLNIGLSGQYATWAGTLLGSNQAIVLITDPGREYESAMRLSRIGLDQVAGFLDHGMAALADRPELVRRAERIDAAQLARELDSPMPPLVLDVRTPLEHQAGKIEGSVNIPLNHLEERIAEVPRGRRVVLQCRTGYRSSIASSLLERKGFANVADMAGGMAAWQALRPTEVQA